MIRDVSYRVAVLRKGGEVSALSWAAGNDPTVYFDASGEIKSSFSGEFYVNPIVDLLSDEIQPILTVDGTEYPLGVFRAATVTTAVTKYGKTVKVEAYDRCWLLKSNKTQTRVHYAKGTSYLTVVQQILTTCGVALAITTASAATLATDREDWEIGTDYLTICNDLLAEINYKRYSLSAVYHIIADNDVDVDSKALRSAAEGVRPLASTEPLTEGVKIEHLRFRFEDAQEDLYTDLSLTIPAGKSVAFIGVTGSGKTTLADVLLGLHAPLSGRVLADGHNIHEEPVWWADRVGYIPQMIYLCNDSIRKNVAFGFSEKDIDDARVWLCLEEAQLKEFVEGLPDGLDSLTGENGVRLSGGQRQRIGIARALYTDPQFLVMDEATSALDNETERAIIESVNRLAGKKTLLIIAHRLTTIEDCDLVFRIENGQARLVREKGKAG